MSDYLELLPAVDITEGRAVQLAQGVAGSERVSGDPVAAARRWQDAGAEWLHLVDLDAAFGRGTNRELQAEIVGALDIKVEMSGGIRDDESLEAALATGCTRVNIGTAALEQPEWCAKIIAEHGDRVAIGLDVRGRTLAARGCHTAAPVRSGHSPEVNHFGRRQSGHPQYLGILLWVSNACQTTNHPAIADSTPENSGSAHIEQLR